MNDGVSRHDWEIGNVLMVDHLCLIQMVYYELCSIWSSWMLIWM